jgi:radical SAM superfamily enzyme YgiQ (UPF0313 family)
MKIILTHAYFLRDDPKEQVIMKPYPPLGLLYLSAWLDQHGIASTVFDTTFSDFSALKAHLLQERPRILAIYANLMTKIRLIELVRFVRSCEALKNTLMVLGGPDVTHNAANYLAIGADVTVTGEGEQSLLELVQAIATADRDSGPQNDKLCLLQVPGLTFLLPDGTLHRTVAREKLRNIDDLPIPAREKIDLQQYLSAWKQKHGHSAISISTQRGCPYTCQWCSTAVYGQSYRRRSPQKVVDEIAFLQKKYDFDLIWFVDDVFTVSHKWLHEFCEVLKKDNIVIQFECITRADRLNASIVQLLRECGCFRVWIGAESGSQRILDAMDRRVEVHQVSDMIQTASRAGIQTGTFIMLGYPGETEADILETVRHLKRSNPDLFTITVAYPIKGTGLYETVQPALADLPPWEESTDRDIDFKRTYPRRYYHAAVRWTVNAVEWHKNRIAGRAFSMSGLKSLGKMVFFRGAMWLTRIRKYAN